MTWQVDQQGQWSSVVPAETPTFMSSSTNVPVYDQLGRRVVLAERWRVPRRPFIAPTCCSGAPVTRLGRNTYRCSRCAARLWPERLYHRLLLRRNPFGPTGVRHIFRVVRWTRP
jgi:hypothetical protein